MNWFSSIISLVTALLTRKITNADTPTSDGSASSNIEPPADIVKPDPVPVRDLSGFDESRIHQDYSVTQKWHDGWKRPLGQITEVVIHHTAGTGNIETLKKWMLGGERKDQYVKGISLFHFAIDKNGKIWKAGPISRWWYHSCSGRHDQFSVGIENIHKSGPFTDAQYENLFWMLFEYMPHFCPSYNRIVSHDYNYNTYSNMKKGCPGPDFDWDRLEREMTRRNITFETHGFEEYTIKFPV
jgi:hypothetical protein